MENNNVNSWKLSGPLKKEPTLEELRKFISENHSLANTGNQVKVEAKSVTSLAGTGTSKVPVQAKLDLFSEVSASAIVPPIVQSVNSTSDAANKSSAVGWVAFGIFLLVVGLISYLVYRWSEKEAQKKSQKVDAGKDSSKYFSTSVFDKMQNSEFGKISKPLLIGLGYVILAIIILYASTKLLRQTKNFVNEVAT